MRIVRRALAGLVLGGLLALAVCIALPWLVPISQAEGAYAMGVVFFWLPAGAVLGALAGLIFGLIG